MVTSLKRHREFLASSHAKLCCSQLRTPHSTHESVFTMPVRKMINACTLIWLTCVINILPFQKYFIVYESKRHWVIYLHYKMDKLDFYFFLCVSVDANLRHIPCSLTALRFGNLGTFTHFTRACSLSAILFHFTALFTIIICSQLQTVLFTIVPWSNMGNKKQNVNDCH